MAVTIYDIAREAGVSYATVSRALNNHPEVNKHTQKTVRRIAKKLGYRSSFSGKTLAAGKTHSIGLVLPDFANPFYLELLRTIEETCLVCNYQMLTLEYALDAKRERACLEEMLRRRCDAVIASVTRFDDTRDLLEEFWGQLPCYVVGLPGKDVIGSLMIDGSIVDLSKGFEEAVEHLYAFGHKNIGYVQSVPPENTDKSRNVGLSHGFSKLDLPFDNDAVFSCFSGNQMQDGEKAMTELLSRRPDITAVICTNDMVACGALKAMSNRGLSCPGDISVIGADNTWLATQWHVSLTSIDQNTRELAKTAVSSVFERLNSNDWGQRRVTYSDSSLVVRDSTGPVRS